MRCAQAKCFEVVGWRKLRHVLPAAAAWVFVSAALAPAVAQSADPPSPEPTAAEALDFLIGEWTGTATLWFPPESDRTTVTEEGFMECRPELDGNYIQCRVRFVRAGGREREMLIYYTHLADEGAHEVLFLFNSWSGKVTYRLRPDPDDAGLFTGSFTDVDDEGVAFTEYIDLRVTDDGRALRGWERIQSSAAPTGEYAQTFDARWRRAGG